jgi:hypothetical protein
VTRPDHRRPTNAHRANPSRPPGVHAPQHAPPHPATPTGGDKHLKRDVAASPRTPTGKRDEFHDGDAQGSTPPSRADCQAPKPCRAPEIRKGGHLTSATSRPGSCEQGPEPSPDPPQSRPRLIFTRRPDPTDTVINRDASIHPPHQPHGPTHQNRISNTPAERPLTLNSDQARKPPKSAPGRPSPDHARTGHREPRPRETAPPDNGPRENGPPRRRPFGLRAARRQR